MMLKTFRAIMFIFLVNNLYSQPLQFHDKIDSVEYTSVNLAGDDKGGWLSLVTAKDSSFSMTLYGTCGQVISNEKYNLPSGTTLSTPRIHYLGRDRFIVTTTLNSANDSKILIFNYILGILSQEKLYSIPGVALHFNPVVSILDQDNMLLAFNYRRDSTTHGCVVKLDPNLNARRAHHINAESNLRFIKLLNSKDYVVGDGQYLRKYDTLGNNTWSRHFPDHHMVFNSVVQNDTQIVFLTDFIQTDTSVKTHYKQLISLDDDGKFLWESDQIRSLKTPYLREYNNRLFTSNLNYVFTGIDTIPGDSIPSIFAHTFGEHGSLISSKYWSAKDSVIDYATTHLDDGNYAVNISYGHADTLKGFANIKTNRAYEGACGTFEFSDVKSRQVITDSVRLIPLTPLGVISPSISILGHTDSLKIKRECEIFDLKDGEVPTPLCKGDSVFLSGIMIRNATYEWSNGSKEAGTWVKEAGDYSVKITYCERSATITYKVFYIDFPDENFALELCDYPYTLDANRGPGASYLWTTGETTSTKEITGPGVYTAQVIKCQMPFTVSFTVTLKKFVDQSFDFKTCNYPDTAYAFQGPQINGASYLWDNGATTAFRQISTPGTYKVTVSYCQSMFVQTFNYSTPEFKDLTDTFQICDFPDNLYAFQGPGIKGATYLWDNGTTDGRREISGPGTYKVTVNYCHSTFTQTFVVKLRQFSDRQFDYNFCEFPGTLYAFQGANIKNATYRWNDGSTDAKLIINQTGTYKVTVSYCQQTFVETFNIKLDEIFFEDQVISDSCKKIAAGLPLTAFADPNKKGLRYIWDNKDTTRVRTIFEAGTYYVDIDFCLQTFRQHFTVKELNAEYLVFPNVFPPNSEIDLNKIFKPVVKDLQLIDDYRLEVYNRWGHRVFESTDPDTGWNGDYKGEPAPMDTYMYLATMKSECGQVKVHKGAVTLVR
jgi:gliding motility-associated-like protein